MVVLWAIPMSPYSDYNKTLKLMTQDINLIISINILIITRLNHEYTKNNMPLDINAQTVVIHMAGPRINNTETPEL